MARNLTEGGFVRLKSAQTSDKMRGEMRRYG